MSKFNSFVARFWQKTIAFCQNLKNPQLLYVLPLILFSPSLFFGPIADDNYHYWKLHVQEPDNSPFRAAQSLFDLFPNQMHPASESIAWWVHEDFQLAFYRPISSLTHWLDSVLWRDVFFLHHLHSLLWACLGVWAVHRLFHRIMGAGWQAVLCTLLFAVQDSHAFVNGWLANRNAIVAFVFGMLAIDAHIRVRTANLRLYWPIFLMTLTLLSAEVGLCAMAFIGSWALFYEKNIKLTVLSLLPYTMLIVVWRMSYRAMGFGASGLTAYVDPITSPLAFVAKLLHGFPLLLANQWYKFPADSILFFPMSARAFPTVVSILCLLPIFYSFGKTVMMHKRLQFWSVGMLVALIPVSAVVPGERMLLFCGVGFVGLLVGLLQQHKGNLAKWFLVLHLPVGMLMCPLKLIPAKLQDMFIIGYESMPVDRHPDEQYFYLNGLEFAPMYSILMPILNKEVVPKRVFLLSPAPDLTLTRIDDRRFEMTLPTGWFDRGAVFFVTPHSFHAGQTFTKGDLHAEILELTAGGQPSRVVFTMKQPLDHTNYRWMLWKGGHYDEIQINYDIGKTVFFPDPVKAYFEGR